MILVGFDPGGLNNFGWAVLEIGPAASLSRLESGAAVSSKAAWRAVTEHVTQPPAGVGIDAPLYWSEDGDRQADAAIRRRVIAAGGHGATVNAVNSMQGACLVQGILLARRAAASWPEALITECHPKALLRIHAEAQRFVAAHIGASISEHARDAALAAYAAWAAARADPGWHDLVPDQAAPFFPGGARISYWFPK